MKKVQWNKLDQLESFTRHVKEGAERLRGVNRRLRNGHSQAGFCCSVLIDWMEPYAWDSLPTSRCLSMALGDPVLRVSTDLKLEEPQLRCHKR